MRAGSLDGVKPRRSGGKEEEQRAWSRVTGWGDERVTLRKGKKKKKSRMEKYGFEEVALLGL